MGKVLEIKWAWSAGTWCPHRLNTVEDRARRLHALRRMPKIKHSGDSQLTEKDISSFRGDSSQGAGAIGESGANHRVLGLTDVAEIDDTLDIHEWRLGEDAGHNIGWDLDANV